MPHYPAPHSALKSAKKYKKVVKSFFRKKSVKKSVEFDKSMNAQCLPQRLKSTFFEIFLNGLAPKEPVQGVQ